MLYLTFKHFDKIKHVHILQGTEELLKQEAGIKEDDVKPQASGPTESDVSHALAAYKR